MPEIGSEIGSVTNPLRVAIIGAGPAGFYTISNFLKYKEFSVSWIFMIVYRRPFVSSGPVWHRITRKTSQLLEPMPRVLSSRMYGFLATSNTAPISILRTFRPTTTR